MFSKAAVKKLRRSETGRDATSQRRYYDRRSDAAGAGARARSDGDSCSCKYANGRCERLDGGLKKT